MILKIMLSLIWSQTRDDDEPTEEQPVDEPPSESSPATVVILLGTELVVCNPQTALCEIRTNIVNSEL